MQIVFDEKEKIFHLCSKGVSYVMQVTPQGWLGHLYWGRRIKEYRGSSRFAFKEWSFSPNPTPDDRSVSLDTLPCEYPSLGNGDFRTPAVASTSSQGGRYTDLRFSGYSIVNGKPELPGLPAVYASDSEAQTLCIDLKDSVTGLKAELFYTVFDEYPVICRSVRFTNEGQLPVTLTRAASASVDLRRDKMDWIHYHGSYVNEWQLCRSKLVPGNQGVSSERGASSHQFAPFIAVCEPAAGEDNGEVYAMNLVYSGNHSERLHVDQTGLTRMTIGLDTETFSWTLDKAESFQTPEAVLAYSAKGMTPLSQAFHALFRTHLMRGCYKEKERPVLINNWEATYFDFDEEKVFSLAKKACDYGIELFVLDDGWYGHRNDDNSSLGDWTANKSKLPNGLPALVKRITSLGMRFGIWFEPEMISVDSDLYREHPDWCLHTEGRPMSYGRNQLVLDFSRKEVCDYVIEAVRSVLQSCEITYVKWDMNRHHSEAGSSRLAPERQGEVPHRFMLGLYYVLETLTQEFPDVLFEGCSGGGGRFDSGFLYYMPQSWLSDNTDAACRLSMQMNASLVYPPVAMGAHVSVTPNHQVGRTTPLDTRHQVAMMGAFGYELDLTKLSTEEEKKVRSWIAFYKANRKLLQCGTYYRLSDPQKENLGAWCVVNEDKSAVAVTCVTLLAQPNHPLRNLCLKGLEPDALYRNRETGKIYGGDELMYAGITIPGTVTDFQANMWFYEKYQE